MTVGDIYWVEFPPRSRHAQTGRRPAILLQTAEASARLPTVLLIPLTTQIDALRFPGTVLIETDADNNLRRPSIALTFQATVVDRASLAGYFGRLTPIVLSAVWEAFDEITGRLMPE